MGPMSGHARHTCLLHAIAALALALGALLLATPTATIVRAAEPLVFVVSSTADTGGSCPTLTGCTLRQAINGSNANDPGAGKHNTITFAAGVTGTISLVGSNPLLTLTRDVAITGPGAQALTVAGPTSQQNFGVNAGVTASISGLTSSGAGYGISNFGTLTVTSSTVSGTGINFYGGGVGIYSEGTLTVTDSTLSGNTSDGIANNGTATVTNSTFSGNSEGINNGGTVTVTNSTFSGNTRAGIGNNQGGTVTVTNSTFSGNATGISNPGTVTVTNSTFSGNTSDGIANYGMGTVTNSTFSGNSTGILNNDFSTVTVTNSTLSGNATGIKNQGTLTVRNSIVAGNTGTNIQGTFTDGGHNLTSGNPKLGSLANNGGPTNTFLLLPGSPAIDAGTNTGCPATDQRGITRPKGPVCDIGAVEVDVAAGPLTFVVSSTADTGGSCPTLTTCTLRQAVNDSNAHDPGAGKHNTITFAAGVTGTITLVNNPLTVTRDVAITGPGARVLTVAGGQNFVVNAGVTASISGLTSNGISNNGTVTVTNSTFSDNGIVGILNKGTATVTSSTFMSNQFGISNNGSATVTNSTFSGGYNGISNTGTLTVTNITLSGIILVGIQNQGTLTVRNSIVAGNGTNIQGSFTDGGHNLTSGDPKLGPLADNGGPTNTLLLLLGSPAFDAGGTAANGCPATDQRGVTRPQGFACDIGAVENDAGGPLTFVVTSTADTDGNCPTLTTCTLRQAVKGSNENQPGAGMHNTITFAAGVTGQISLVNGPLTLTRDVAITVPGPGALIVAGTAGGQSFVVNVGVTASISGLTSSGAGDSIVNNGTLTVTKSTLSGNRTGIQNQGGTLTVTNSTFSGNTSAGILNTGSATVTNSTLSGNSVGIQNQSTLTVRNSIVAGNTGANIQGPFTDGGHNLIGGDPKLGPLADNGGPTNTLLPLPGSPAIDAGGTAANGCPATDQRGITRPQGAACDIGAVEVALGPLAFVVTSTADTGGVCPTATTCTLRQAVNSSNANDPGVGKHNTITFALPSGPQTITLVNGGLTMTRDVAITGPGPGALAVLGTLQGNMYINNFTVNGGVTASISGLTSYGAGTGITNNGTLTVTDCTLSWNIDGIDSNGTLTVTNSAFSSNSDDGIVNSGGTLTVTNSTFNNNTNNGIVNGGTMTVTNSTFSNNGDTGIINNGGTVTVTNSTVSGNATGIFANGGALTLRNSIVAGNSTQNILGSFTDGGHNLTGGDPKLGPLADNGGPTNTLLLLPGSPAIDAGGTAANGCPAKDQRGITRPQGTACDIGAVELAVGGGPVTFVVTSTADTGGLCPTLTTCTLRQAVNSSNSNDPGAGKHNTITFAAGVTGTITRVIGPLTVTRDVAITGPGAHALTVTGIGIGATNFVVNGGVTASISGLTSSGAGDSIVNNGTLTVTDCTFSSTTTGIQNQGGTLTVTSSTFSNNDNGIYNNTGTATVTNSTLSNNDSGIVNKGTLTVTNSTLSGNATGIVNNGGTVTVRNSIVAGNTGANIQGSFTDGGHNLIGGDPKLGPLADNGGPTNTLLLLPGSPAIDAGGTAANGCPAKDQRGITRPQGTACDIGAVELAVAAGPLVLQVAITGGNNQQQAIGKTFKEKLTVKVTDQSNTPLSGVTVTFTAPSTGASGCFGEQAAEFIGRCEKTTTVQTDSDGMASVRITASLDGLGEFTVTASVPGGSLPARFRLTDRLA